MKRDVYKRQLYESGLKLNTISTYMPMLRSIYNRGVEAGSAPYEMCIRDRSNSQNETITDSVWTKSKVIETIKKVNDYWQAENPEPAFAFWHPAACLLYTSRCV